MEELSFPTASLVPPRPIKDSEATGGLEPDLTVLLDLPVETALARKDGGSDNYDDAPLEFHRKIRLGYTELAAANPDYWLVMDGLRTSEELSKDIWSKVQTMI